jgi:hypothetical protein
MNLENCLRSELPPNLDWLRNQLVGHLKELRDRARKGEVLQVLHEFFDCYRFDDSDKEPDGFWGSYPRAMPDGPSNETKEAPQCSEGFAYVWYIEPQLAVGGGWSSVGSWQYRYRNTQGGASTVEEALKKASDLCPNIRVGKNPLTEVYQEPPVPEEGGFGPSQVEEFRSWELRLIQDILDDLGTVSFCHGEPAPWVIQFPGDGEGRFGSRYRFATPGGALDMAHFERRCKKGEA